MKIPFVSSPSSYEWRHTNTRPSISAYFYHNYRYENTKNYAVQTATQLSFDNRCPTVTEVRIPHSVTRAAASVTEKSVFDHLQEKEVSVRSTKCPGRLQGATASYPLGTENPRAAGNATVR